MGATFHRPGEGENFEIGGSGLSIKATGDETGGSFFLSETRLEPGFPGPPLHVHHKLHDMFYVLEGTMALQLGDEVVEAPPGSFVCVPPETPHTFANPGSEPVRMLNFNTPGGWEHYMRDLVAAWQQHDGPPPPEEIGKVASRYDFEAAGPPIDA